MTAPAGQAEESPIGNNEKKLDYRLTRPRTTHRLARIRIKS